MKLLHIDTSIPSGRSVSRELSALIVKRLTAGRQVKVTYRDLATEDVPHLTAVSLPSAHPGSAMAGPLDAAAQAIRDASERMLEEFLPADTVVLGAPMYKLHGPHPAQGLDRPHCRTLNNVQSRPEWRRLTGQGQTCGRGVRDGFYGAETAAVSAEHAESLLCTAFGSMGITPGFVMAEGLNAGLDNQAKAVASAQAVVDRLAA